MTKATITHIDLNKALDNSKEFARENVHDKVKYQDMVNYAPKKIKLQPTKAFAEMLSQAYAFKACHYDVDSKARNNIAYHTDEIEKLASKDELTKPEKLRMELHMAERAKVQSGLRHYVKTERATIQPILDDIASRLYNPYVNRQVDRKAWDKALADYFASYEVKYDKSVGTFISDNVGSKIAKVRNYHSHFISNWSVNQFAEFVLHCLLQLALDKSMINTKIVQSTLDGAKEEVIGEIYDYVYVKKLDETSTKEEYAKVLSDIGLKTKTEAMAMTKDELKAEYKKAKKTGLFVEY